MELLLNLLWLTLALPAIWMGLQEPVHAQRYRRFNRFRSFLLLGCILMLLFPVVSATDDLHAVRQEMEEPGTSKRLAMQPAGEKTSVRLHGVGVSAAYLASAFLFRVTSEACAPVIESPTRLPQRVELRTRASRAPPASYPG